MNDAITREQMYSTTCCLSWTIRQSSREGDSNQERERTDLFVDRASLAEDDVTANETGEERIETSFLAPIRLLLDQQQGLVQRNVFHEICSVGLGRLKDGSRPGAPAAGNEHTAPPGEGGGCELTLHDQTGSP